MQPRPVPLIVSALVFTTLLCGLPMLHLGLRPSGLALVLLLLPPAVVIAILLAPRHALLTHFAFPLAHLPLLIARPDLTGPRIYAGPAGLVAFLAVIGAGTAWFVATTPRLSASHARFEPLVAVSLAAALAPLLALTAPALATDRAPWASLTGLALGPLLAWWLVARGLAHDVALPAIDPGERVRVIYTLRQRVRPRTLAFTSAAILSVIALGLIAFWYLWSPR